MLTSAIDSWFYTSLAGIQVDESDPAFANILIKPYIPEDLNWVTARINTIHGQISSAWRVVNNTLTLEVAIPANTRAFVQVPYGNLPAVMVNDLPAGKAEGVISAQIQGKVAAFRIGSGNYVITFPSLR
ncbi:MAG: alpha-L-rhamnosidase C-terminal domain-containing protein [Verrucomicrobiota bacterium]